MSDSDLPWHIYTLADPREPTIIRYVGVTNHPDRRFREHITRTKRNEDRTHCGRWKRKLLSEGFRPDMVVIDSGFGDTWVEAESRWIAHYKKLSGELLCNLTEGGKGVRGHQCSEETRQLIRTIHTGMKASVEARENMRQAQQGRTATTETKIKMSEAHKGRKKSAAHRANIGVALQGNKNGLGRQDNEEIRAKRRESIKAAWARRKGLTFLGTPPAGDDSVLL